MTQANAKNLSRRRGLTLLECMAALVVLSVALVAVLSTTVAGQQHLSAADRAMAGTRLARDLVEEISALPFEEPTAAVKFGVETGETGRQSYDDVDDYNGYAEAAGQVRDQRGTLYSADLQAYVRRVTVAAQTLNLPKLGAVPGKLVTVKVTHAKGGEWTHARFIPQPPG